MITISRSYRNGYNGDRYTIEASADTLEEAVQKWAKSHRRLVELQKLNSHSNEMRGTDIGSAVSRFVGNMKIQG